MLTLRSTAPFFVGFLTTIWLVVWLVSPCGSPWPMSCARFRDLAGDIADFVERE